MVPWGTVCERSLPGICGLGEYHTITKGGSGGYGQKHGPYHQHSPYPPKINGYLWHCGVIQGTHANFYKVTQSNHKKVPSFAMRLEGTLNQIRLQCPRWITDQEVQHCPKDCLFHRVCKHIRLDTIPLQQSWDHLFPTHDCCSQGGEWKWWSLCQGEGQVSSDHWTCSGHYRVGKPDS